MAIKGKVMNGQNMPETTFGTLGGVGQNSGSARQWRGSDPAPGLAAFLSELGFGPEPEPEPGLMLGPWFKR